MLTRPATAYKKVFTPLAEKAAIVFEASAKGVVVVGSSWTAHNATMPICCRHLFAANRSAAPHIVPPTLPLCGSSGAPGAVSPAGRLRFCQLRGDCGPPGPRQGKPALGSGCRSTLG